MTHVKPSTIKENSLNLIGWIIEKIFLSCLPFILIVFIFPYVSILCVCVGEEAVTVDPESGSSRGASEEEGGGSREVCRGEVPRTSDSLFQSSEGTAQ